jgi:hypothetical protein
MGRRTFAAAVWMIVVLNTGSLFLAKISNYPGVCAARWVQYRGTAPSSAMVWSFNVWLVLTSAIEWMLVGLVLPAALTGLFRSTSRFWLHESVIGDEHRVMAL